MTQTEMMSALEYNPLKTRLFRDKAKKKKKNIQFYVLITTGIL